MCFTWCTISLHAMSWQWPPHPPISERCHCCLFFYLDANFHLGWISWNNVQDPVEAISGKMTQLQTFCPCCFWVLSLNPQNKTMVVLQFGCCNYGPLICPCQTIMAVCFPARWHMGLNASHQIISCLNLLILNIDKQWMYIFKSKLQKVRFVFLV